MNKSTRLTRHEFARGAFLVTGILALLFAMTSVMRAQDTVLTPLVNQANSNTSPSPTSTPVPISEIVPQSEKASASLKQISAAIEGDPTIEIVEGELPNLIAGIDTHAAETARVIEGRASLERLRSVEAQWKSLTKELEKWNTRLTARAKELEIDLKGLAALDEKWKNSLEELKTVEAPREITIRVDEILSTITRIRGEIEANRSRIVALQSKIAEQKSRVDDAVKSIQQTRESLVDRLLVQDSPPMWSAGFWTRARAENPNESITGQWASLKEFATQNTGRLTVHFLIFLGFVGVLIFLRRFARPWVEEEPDLRKAAIIFSFPISTATILAIFLNGWIYSQTPQLLQAIFGAVVLVPTVIIVRKLVERPLYPLLYSLVVFYLIDQVRMVAEGLPVISRLVFIAEMLIGLTFFLWLIFGRLAINETDEKVHGRVFRTIRLAAIIAVPIFAVSALANALGYLTLAQLLGNAVLRSAYAAIILYAVVRIVDGLIIFALRFRPLRLLGMVRNHRVLIQYRLRRAARWLGSIVWIIVVLDLLAVRTTLFEAIWETLGSELKLGSFTISLTDILAFVVAVWASFLLSRFIRFALEEDVYPRFRISRGLPYAISTVLHYALIVLGFLLALAIIGIDLTKFTIIAGAFGVGIGFGLQNIVNNFVSGIILLFERPVNVGDTVQVGEDLGDLTRIGLRASVIRTLDGSEVIVPNGNLVSEKVVNWTLSDQQRRLEINVGVAYGTDPRLVIELLKNVGGDALNILKIPGPSALFLGFGDSSLDFQLRVWTDKFTEWVAVKSEVTLAVHDALRDAQIEIPFPQRDIHIIEPDKTAGEGLD
ncbi:MAG: mechanosensitive ion channel domain-containing protein [Acidobacteriota bacterium]